ncbi:MAG: GTPase [Clostridiales bacterium]|nr:GTPase [Clostridiales bacterium]
MPDQNYPAVPVYLITGFLESGKSTFINFVVRQDYFAIPELTVLIATEEGEVEYDKEELRKYNTELVVISDQEDFNYEHLNMIEKQYDPGRVIVEYNPLWGVEDFCQMRLPVGWGICQSIAHIDASTFQLYQQNMMSLFADIARNAELIIFNRCQSDMPLAGYRRSIKVVNGGCDVQFEDESGEPMNIFSDTVPYDLTKDIVDIDDADFGIFFIDLRDNPDRYRDKKFRFKGRVMKSRNPLANYFMPARAAMTCCADDIQYIGNICYSKKARKLTEGAWVEVVARVDYKMIPFSQEIEPCLYEIRIKDTTPPETELVYFN